MVGTAVDTAVCEETSTIFVTILHTCWTYEFEGSEEDRDAYSEEYEPEPSIFLGMWRVLVVRVLNRALRTLRLVCVRRMVEILRGQHEGRGREGMALSSGRRVDGIVELMCTGRHLCTRVVGKKNRGARRQHAICWQVSGDVTKFML